MKKSIFFLMIGLMIFSGAALFAQTTQGAQSGQMPDPNYFAGGGYKGPVLGITTIEDLRDAAPNTFVIVEGYLIQQRVPGTYVLADSADRPTVSVVIRLSPYFWSNLEIDAKTPVLVYGAVNRSDLRIEVEATRIEIKK